MSTPQGLSFYAGGVNLASALTSFSPQAEAESLDSTTLSNTYRTYRQGFKSGTLAASGLFDYDQTNLNKLHNVMSIAFDNRSELVVSASFGALAVNADAILMDGTVQSYAVETVINQLITTSVNLQSNNSLNFGKWLFSASVSNTTTNGTTVDNGAATANGGLFHVHAQNASNFAGNVKLQHSTDGSTWVDLATCTLTAANDYEGLSATIAKGTTVNRYTRAVATATGGAITFQAAFARR